MVTIVVNDERFGASAPIGWLRRLAPLWCALAFIALQAAAVQQTVPMQGSYRYGVKTPDPATRCSPCPR
jgi:hypothetical protein